MIDEASQLLQRLDGFTSVSVRKATFIEVDAGFAVVDMGDSRFVADFGCGYVPMSGETVQIISVGGQHLLFPAGPKPRVGTVATAPALQRVKVSTSSGVISMPYVGSPTSGDRVLVDWTEDGPVCGLKISTSAPPPDPIPDPGGGTIQSATFRAIDTGSTDRDQARWWQAQPWASNTTYGAWFYGSQIRDTIPAGAVFESLEFFVAWEQRQGADPRFALHNLTSKDAVPVMGPYTAWNPNPGWVVPPMAAGWFNELKAGGSAAGVGLNQGGWNKFASLVQNSMSGALRISWRT